MTTAGIIQLNALQQKRLQDDLQSMLTRSFPRSIHRPGRFLSLIAFTHVSDVTLDGTCYSHYAVRVKDQEANAIITMKLTLAVNEVIECSVN